MRWKKCSSHLKSARSYLLKIFSESGSAANPKSRLKAAVSAKTKVVAGVGGKKKGAEANPKLRLKAEVATKTKAVACGGSKKSSAAASGISLGKLPTAVSSGVVKGKGLVGILSDLASIDEAPEDLLDLVSFSAVPSSKQLDRIKAPQASVAASKGPADEAVSDSSDKGKVQDQGSRLSRRRGGLSDILNALDLGCISSSESPDRKPDSFLVSRDPRCFVLASTNDASDNARSVSQDHSTSNSAGVDLSFMHHASHTAAQEAMASGPADSGSDSEDNEELSHIFGGLGIKE